MKLTDNLTSPFCLSGTVAPADPEAQANFERNLAGMKVELWERGSFDLSAREWSWIQKEPSTENKLSSDGFEVWMPACSLFRDILSSFS